MKQKILLTAATVAIIGGGMLNSTTAFAQNQTSDTGHMSSLAQKIADKFGLNKAEVEAVFEEEHQARHAEMQAKYEEQLSQYVTDGKITEAQKQLIIAKNAELENDRQTKRENFKDMTVTERKAVMEAERTALEEWAKTNGIDMQYLMKKVFFKGHGGPGEAFKGDVIMSTTPAE